MKYTQKSKDWLVDYLKNHELPEGMGSKESACSIAAINLSIDRKLTDKIPECMSRVLGKATIKLQDAMPDKMRNSSRYKNLLPHMAGTGRDREFERAKVIRDWMWTVVLPEVQPYADKGGFGKEWQDMCQLKTSNAAYAAAFAVNAEDDCFVSEVATEVADNVGYVCGTASASPVISASYAADVAAVYVSHFFGSDTDPFWSRVDPIGALERATFLKEKS